jgi:hypothetical protein
MRIFILTTDNREPHNDYANLRPHFGTAPATLADLRHRTRKFSKPAYVACG